MVVEAMGVIDLFLVVKMLLLQSAKVGSLEKHSVEKNQFVVAEVRLAGPRRWSFQLHA
jgi:hypothetical protein